MDNEIFTSEKEKIDGKKLDQIVPKKILSDISLEIQETKNDYVAFYQGKITNAFTAVSKKSKHMIDQDSHAWLFPTEELGSSIVTLTKPEKNELSLSTSKLLDAITIMLTEILPYNATDEQLSKFLDFNIDVYKYMEYCNLQDKNQTVKQLKKNLEALFNASTTATVTRYEGKKRIEEVQDLRFIDEKPHGQIRKTAHIHIALSFARYLVHNQIMAYPTKILLTSKNQNVYYLGKRLAELYNMNRNKSNKDSINIENLLKFTPNIPTLEEENHRGRHYRERCIEPLEKALQELLEIEFLKEWHFLNAEKKQIPYDKLLKWSITVEDWKKIFIHFVIKDYPEENNLKITQK